MKSLESAIADARSRYASLNPLSAAADKEAERYLPDVITELEEVFVNLRSDSAKGENP